MSQPGHGEWLGAPFPGQAWRSDAATLSMMPTDHYLVLGVRPDARPPEIRAAYLRLMRDNHPDLRPGDPAAAATARRVNAAYQVVGDASRRAPYDRARSATNDAARLGQDRVDLLRAAAKARRAYADQHRGYRQAFRSACLRVGVAIVVLGTAMLLAVA